MKRLRKKCLSFVLVLVMFFSLLQSTTLVEVSVAADTGMDESKQQIMKDSGGASPGIDQLNADGVRVSKTIAGTGYENYFDITLEVVTTETIETIIAKQNIAVVVVMDISNTMLTYNISGKLHKDEQDGIIRYTEAISAGADFINLFAAASSSAEGAIRQIGYVAFNSNAHEIFELSECESSDDASSLIIKMQNNCNTIISGDYGNSPDRFTNIEAGLLKANDMLKDCKAENKYVIFISDGYPTTYVSDYSNYSGFCTFMDSSKNDNVPMDDNSDAGGSGNGYFKNRKTNPELLCSGGTNYSDRAATRAQDAAEILKEAGLKIYTIGVGIEKQTLIPDLVKEHPDTVDCYNSNYAYVIGTNRESFVSWLTEKIGSNHYYSASESGKIKEAYQKIFEDIKKQMKTAAIASIVEDPMYDGIEFIGFLDNDGKIVCDKDGNTVYSLIGESGENKPDTASFDSSKEMIRWDLKNSGYVKSTSDNTTTYTYSITYRVRLKNELSNFVENTYMCTNGKTTLTYDVQKTDGTSESKYIDFPIPKVEGYLADLTFKKVSEDCSALPDADFSLTHDTNCVVCGGTVNINGRTATSGSDGLVKFSSLPSGHTYTLVETSAPDGYQADTTKYSVTVSYDKITTNLATQDSSDNLVVVNKATGNLVVSKTVSGNAADQDKYFEFTVKLDNTSINGTYGDMTFKDGVTSFSLKHGECKKAIGLLANTGYTVFENSNEGYTVSIENSGATVVTGSALTHNTATVATGSALAINTATVATGVIPVHNTATVAFRNYKNIYQREPEPEYGNLKVSKTVTGNAADKDKYFTFTVTLSNTSITGIYGGMSFVGGVANFSLKHGDSKMAINLPAGITYTVSENDSEDYTVSVNGVAGNTDTGILKSNETVSAAFINHKESELELETGSLRVSKTVSGSGASKQKEFTFTVTIKKLNGTYGDMTFVDGVATFKLSDGQSKMASGLPVGATYTVVERNNKGYTVSVNETRDSKASGTITSERISTVAFTNYKPGSATVVLKAKKTLDGAVPGSETFTFYLKDSNGNILQEKTNNSKGSIKFDKLTFSEEGTYTYTVVESIGTVRNINYDTAVYTVIIEVTKSGDYHASVSYEKDGVEYNGTLVFENTTNSGMLSENIINSDDPNETEIPNTPMLDDVPKTGDESHMTLWFIMMIVSFISLGAIIIARRSNRYKTNNR